MDSAEKEKRLFLSFDSVEEFEKVLGWKGPNTGFFFESTRAVSAGQMVSIVVSIKGVKEPVFLEGMIIRRRIKSGGPNLPPGIFVMLSDHDRARLEGIVKHLKATESAERRDCPRYPVALPATYHTSEGKFSSKVRNLSHGGAFLLCTGPLLTVGVRFPLEVVIVDKKGKQKTLPLYARVAWIDYFDEHKGMGVAFLKGQSQLKKIRRHLDTHAKKLWEQKSTSL